MTEYDNSNRGVLFRQQKKTSDRAPDYTGKLNVEGVDFELAGWIKESKAGNKFLSLSVQVPHKQEEKPAKPKDEKYRAGLPDSDIPF